MSFRFLLLLGCLLLGSACGGPPGGDAEAGREQLGTSSLAITALTQGVPVNNLSGAASTEQFFTLQVPAGATSVKFTLSGGTGDPDLYVKFGSTPTTSSYTCKSAAGGTGDSCSVSAPQAGTWYVLVRAYTAYSGVSLVGTYTVASTEPTTLNHGQLVTGLSAVKDGALYFVLNVPVGQKTVKFTLSGGSGDPDLFANFGSKPTTSTYRCASTNSGSAETCSVSSPEPGLWYVMVRGYAAFSGVSLVGEYSPPTNELDDNRPIRVSGEAGSQIYYTLEVPAGQSVVRFRTSGGSGNVNLRGSFGAPPTATSSGCVSESSGNYEECSFTAPQAGTYYVMLIGAQAYADVTLVGYSQTASGGPVGMLVNDTAVEDLSGATGDSFSYALDVPAGQTRLQVNLLGSGNGDADLFVRFGEKPTTTTYDCQSIRSWSDDACTVNNPQPGTWYILVRGKSAFSGVVLLATYSVNGEVPVVALREGQRITQIASSGGQDRYYTLEVPAGYGKLRFDVGSTAYLQSPEIYVAFGARPNPAVSGSYVCNSKYECEIDMPQAGTWHVLLRGPSFGFVKGTLVARYSGVLRPDQALVNGEWTTHIAASTDDVRYFTVNVPTGQARLAFEFTNDSGDVSIYVRRGARPTEGTYDCQRSFSGPTRQGCVFNAPGSGIWYVMVMSREEIAGLAIKATHAPSVTVAPTQELVNGEWVTGLSGSPFEDRYYRLVVPPNATSLSFERMGEQNDTFFFVRYGSLPTTSVYDCSTSCTPTNPTAGSWYILVRGRVPFSGQGVRGTFTEATPLTAGTWAGVLKGMYYQERFFRIDVPSGAPVLRIETLSASGKQTSLFVKRGGLPLTSSDCSSTLSGGAQLCGIVKPQAGTWYARVRFEYFAGDTTDVNVRAQIEGASEPETPLADNVALELLPSASPYRLYTLEVPEGQTLVTFDLFTADSAELSVRHAAAPTSFNYKCLASSSPTAPNASCSVPAPAAGTWYALVKADSGFKGVLRGTVSSIPALISGIPELPASGALGEQRLYKLEVPEGMSDLAFSLRRGTGTPGLSVRYGAPPAGATYDCATKDLSPADLTCAFVNPLAGTWYVAISDTASAFSNAILTGTYARSPGEGIPTLTNGVPVVDVNGVPFEQKLWKIEVPEGQSRLKIDLSGGSGLASLYVQHAVRPTFKAFACSAIGTSGNVATCIVPNPQAGTWFVRAHSRYSFDGAYLTGTFSRDGDVRTLARGLPHLNLSSTADAAQYFQVEVPEGQSFLSFHLFGSVANAVLTARPGALPTAADSPCAAKAANHRACEFPSPAPGTWYVRLGGTFQGAMLSTDFVDLGATDGIEPLVNGAPLKTSSSTSAPRLYKLEVPAGMSMLTFTTSGVSEPGVELRVLLGSPASQHDYDCLSNGPTSSETCSFKNPVAGTWYVQLSGSDPTVKLTGSYR
ncbi:PPC domain-containing protein [Archangium violaceum]|uniref:PPC domain-containing protein n=1 Tax=Archangium violaceum TaxID=83451 RepID=UPI002B3154D7|nr:PPC domain-containing protein [Archangium gephyra]